MTAHRQRYESLQPAISMLEFPRKFFVVVDPATQSDEAQRFQVWNLETAPAAIFDVYIQKGIRTSTPPLLPGAIDLSNIDTASWGPMDRWWVLNELYERGGHVRIYDSHESAQTAADSLNAAAIAASEQSQKIEASV